MLQISTFISNDQRVQQLFMKGKQAVEEEGGGPGSLSFLRSHKPRRFGDRMDNIRHTIVAVNDEKMATSGFETGRVVSGIRGVSPVFTTDPVTGEKIHIGALEVGTSFKTMLSLLYGPEANTSCDREYSHQCD